MANNPFAPKPLQTGDTYTNPAQGGANIKRQEYMSRIQNAKDSQELASTEFMDRRKLASAKFMDRQELAAQQVGPLIGLNPSFRENQADYLRKLREMNNPLRNSPLSGSLGGQLQSTVATKPVNNYPKFPKNQFDASKIAYSK
jgi:hypothetical protein